MKANIRNEIAQMIRRNDGRNKAKPEVLAMAIEDELHDLDIYTLQWRPLADFIKRVNPNKTMGAAALADAIVDEFGLDATKDA